MADKAQQHAGRLQAGANRARESAERAQRNADMRLDPVGDGGKMRQVKPKDSAPASNKPEGKKKNEG